MSATAVHGVTLKQVTDALRPGIEKSVRKYYERYSSLNIQVRVAYPEQIGSVLEKATTVNFSLASYSNYTGRSVIPVQVIGQNQQVPSVVKVIVDVDVSGNMVVAADTIAKGQVIEPGNVILVSGMLNGQPKNGFGSLSGVIGKESVTVIPGESIITQTQIREVPVVRRGDVVTVDYQNRGIELRVPGSVLEDGKIGDRVKVRLRLESAKIMEGEVVNSSTVRVRIIR
ncbi:flagella basal body P-ring formation protein FlgA [bacterium]|nr:flagella basal body P-ring formation protein FlgA [bacterium]